jgi:hypothetical protein
VPPRWTLAQAEGQKDSLIGLTLKEAQQKLGPFDGYDVSGIGSTEFVRFSSLGLYLTFFEGKVKKVTFRRPAP